MISQKTVTLNDFGLARRDRTTSKGTSSRYTVTLDARPLVLDFDTKTLGRGLATRIADHLRARVAAIGAEASPSTQLQRKYAANAMSSGKPWASRRYTGGRIGVMSPNQSPRLFNDSGRFVRGITASPTRDNNWVINVPANRLNAAQLGSETALKDIFHKLRLHVPEFGSASELLKVPEIQDEVRAAIRVIYDKKRARGNERLRELTQELIKITLEESSRIAEE